MIIAAKYERLILTANHYDSYLLSVTTDGLTSEASFSRGGRR
jgi:hypothetical protein